MAKLVKFTQYELVGLIILLCGGVCVVTGLLFARFFGGGAVFYGVVGVGVVLIVAGLTVFYFRGKRHIWK